jgi:hypothetical protein
VSIIPALFKLVALTVRVVKISKSLIDLSKKNKGGGGRVGIIPNLSGYNTQPEWV